MDSSSNSPSSCIIAGVGASFGPSISVERDWNCSDNRGPVSDAGQISRMRDRSSEFLPIGGILMPVGLADHFTHVMDHRAEFRQRVPLRLQVRSGFLFRVQSHLDALLFYRAHGCEAHRIGSRQDLRSTTALAAASPASASSSAACPGCA